MRRENDRVDDGEAFNGEEVSALRATRLIQCLDE